MARARNNRSIADLFTGIDTTIRHYVIDRPRAYVETIRRRLRNLPETNFRLGCDFAEQGKWMDAVFRFKMAIYFKPDYAQAYYNLGACYVQLNKMQEARNALRKSLQLKPGNEDALFMLSAIDPGSIPPAQLPKTMPKEMVTGFFSSIAAEYDAIADRNQYRGPQIVFEGAKTFLAKSNGLKIADLGCGTGLAAKPWRGLANEITGIDCTHAIIAEAHKARTADMPVYERVLEADVNQLPADALAAQSMDLVLVIDTAQFLGDLKPVMAAVAACLAPKGVVAITIEPYQTKEGYAVNAATGRFGHTPDYVKQLAALHGMKLERDGKVQLYGDLQGYLLIFAKE